MIDHFDLLLGLGLDVQTYNGYICLVIRSLDKAFEERFLHIGT